jgi:hypothetical protein
MVKGRSSVATPSYAEIVPKRQQRLRVLQQATLDAALEIVAKLVRGARAGDGEAIEFVERIQGDARQLQRQGRPVPAWMSPVIGFIRASN